MKGKEKCKALKEIRQKIAEQNDIAFAVSECTHQGDCKGTCPKCEAELRYLERQLEIRKNLGKAVVVAGISAGMCAPMVACSPIESIGDAMGNLFNISTDQELEGATQPPEDLAGDVEYIPEDVQGMEGPAPEEYIEGGLLEDEELELTGEETWNPDLEEPSEEDLDAILPSEEDPEALAGEVECDPNYEWNSEEDAIIDDNTLEGDVVIDPEYLDEE